MHRRWLLQDRKCCLCEREIPFDLIHGDHIVPHSQGGVSEFSNLQALCGSCNLRKGSNPQEVAEEFFSRERLAAGAGTLRRWQAEALEDTARSIEEGEPVLVEACPGAGKTHFGLELAYRLLVAGTISRLLIFAPTRAIAEGWADAASRANPASPTIPLRVSGRDWRVTEPIDLGGNVAGAVSTYQALAAMPDMFLAHATDPGHRTLVIFDEVHHSGAGSSWGLAAQEAFRDAARQVVSLSGTPFRTDRDQIAFVESKDGSAVPDYRYGYSEAIRDDACRPVEFVEFGGDATFEDADGQMKTTSFGDEELSELGERRMLRAALEWLGDGGIAAAMLAHANEFLLALRASGDLDAAGLVVCVDCDHADQVAAHLRQRLAPRGVNVACSRSNDANDAQPGDVIRRFRRSNDPWIVAVNMVSEGVDIKRLRTVVYLTNRSTLLSFRQIVGRVVRTDRNNDVDFGRVYVPGDPDLLEMSRTIQAEAPALPKPIKIIGDTGGVIRVGDLTGREDGDLSLVGTVGAEGAAFDTAGREADRSFINRCREYIALKGLNGTSPESLALAASESPELRRAIESATEAS